MVALLLSAASWAQDPVKLGTDAGDVPSGGALVPVNTLPQAGAVTPTGYQPIPVACKTESACSTYEEYKTCEAPSCDFMTDPELLSRQICKRDDGFTAWCVKPLEPPHSTSGACICDSGSPAGGWLAGVALAFVGLRKRRA